MPHVRSPNLYGSLSDRALRPWPEAAVLLIVFVAARSICAKQEFKATRRVFPKLNVPRFVVMARPPCVQAPQQTLLGRLLCCSKFIAVIDARPCWAAQQCWRYLALCGLQAQALKNSLRQIHRRRRQLPRSRRRLHRPLLPSRSSRHRRRHQQHRRPHHKQAVVVHNYLKSMYAQLGELRRALQRGAPRRRQSRRPPCRRCRQLKS